jgi:hypothetical protein
MKKSIFIFTILLISLFYSDVIAQTPLLLPPFQTLLHSRNVSSYITKTDGEKITFLCSGMKYKKGLILSVEGIQNNGGIIDLKAEDIQSLELSTAQDNVFFGYAKMGLEDEKPTFIELKMDVDSLNRPLVHYEKVYIEDLKTTVLLQLLNPKFCQKIRLYDKPTNFAPYHAAFYVKKGEKTTVISRKEYKKTFPTLYEGCTEMGETYKEINWKELADHLFFYEKSCK